MSPKQWSWLDKVSNLYGLRSSGYVFYYSILGRWSPRGRPWPRGRSRGHILKSLALASKIKYLALASKPQVLKNCLSSAGGQHYFLHNWNFVGKRQKPRWKFANTFFVFRNWSIGVAKGEGGRGPGPPRLKFYQWQKCDQTAYCFFSFSFFLAFFAHNSN